MYKAVLAIALVLASASVQGREIHWRQLAVRAQLANDGALRISERHAMVFTGDWNGGERIFRIEPHQTLRLHGVTRVAADGKEYRLREGDLDQVDNFQLTDGATLRWRSRAAGDPEFVEQQLVYVLDYTLENILLPNLIGDSRRYTLNHDFAFAAREGVIEDYSLEIRLDSVWNSPSGTLLRRQATNLVPGESFVVTLVLDFAGEDPPAAVNRATALVRLLRPYVVPVPMLILLLVFFVRQWSRRRIVPTDDGPIDEAWIERNVLRYPPEVAGTFLHGKVGPPEFAAVIARMEQEGKIRTWVVTPNKGKPNIHLELLVGHEQLRDAEHAIARKLFLSRNETNAAEIRREHMKSGFDPPALIRDHVLAAAKEFGTTAEESEGFGNGGGLAVAGLLLAGFAGSIRPGDFGVIFLILFGGMLLALFGMHGGMKWKSKRRVSGIIQVLAVPFIAWLISDAAQRIITLSDGTTPRFSLLGMMALAVGFLGVFRMILAVAEERLTPEAAAIRRTLERARDFFRKELSSAEPRISDRWTPWLIAMGLDGSIASWWKSHRVAESSTGGSSDLRDSESIGASSTLSSPSSFTGGGGAFGGAGASGSWGAAALSLSTPISSPSSSGGSESSSSSSSSSDSSSGGGGGGGW